MATSSESGGSGSSSGGRVRSVKLVRRSPPAKLGFSVRGGKEHRTGFFVTAVEPSSEAHIAGLRIGDQIIRVNGYPVDDATHKELLQLIQGHNSLILKVRTVGMIPEKEEGSDELSWRIVEPDSLISFKTDLSEELRQNSEVPLILKVPPKAKLGCGICKGPEWKPGIFVQFTKENSIARTGGLRPGDQIVQCNNVLFTPDMPFNEAVSIMRGCGVLELLVRKGAGLELFPGESSGYNSSASSVAGDHPTSWTHTNKINNEPNNNRVPENGVNGVEKRLEYLTSRKRPEYTNGGSTIIQVGGEQTDTSKSKVAEICMVSQQLETKTTTVLVEVHHSEEDNVSNTQSDVSTDRLTNSSVSSFTSSASSLSSAISQELERRSKRPPAPPTPKCPKNQPPTEKLLKAGMTKEELHQHEKLMQEFKKAHQKMFSAEMKEREENGFVNGDATVPSNCNGDVKEKREKLESKKLELSKKLENGKKTEITKKERMDNKMRAASNKDDEINGNRPRNKKQPAPPPPPPMPSAGCDGGKTKKQAPAPPDSPPSCPTPDYDTMSLASEQGGVRQCDHVDMQSLESFRLTNPTSQKPKPPNTYFPKSSSESSHSTASTVVVRDNRPLVTIREYGGGGRHPSRLEFLPPATCGNQHSPTVCSADTTDQPVQLRLASELSHTLSRSNLNQENHQVLNNNNLNSGHQVNGCKGSIIKISVETNNKDHHHNHHHHHQMPQQVLPPPTNNNNNNTSTKPAPFYLFPNEINNRRNGLIAVAPAAKENKNSVSFNLVGKEATRNGSHPNGILKNGAQNNISHVQIHPGVDKMPPHKSIKFGAITTVIRDSPEPKA